MISESKEKNEYTLIKEWLQYGDIQELAATFGISRSAAYKILRGGSRNFEFKEAAFNMAIERALKHKALQEKLESI